MFFDVTEAQYISDCMIKLRFEDGSSGTVDLSNYPNEENVFRELEVPRNPDEHMKILKNSSHIVIAIDTSIDRVIGFITALTDGIQSAFIPLLEVLAEYRKQGIGSSLVSRMLDKLKGIPAIDLTCDPTLQKFYSKFGMILSVGMNIREY